MQASFYRRYGLRGVYWCLVPHLWTNCLCETWWQEIKWAIWFNYGIWKWHRNDHKSPIQFKRNKEVSRATLF